MRHGSLSKPHHWILGSSVRYRNKAKTVIYRSGGDATQRPVAFANAQDRIMKFAKRITARAR